MLIDWMTLRHPLRTLPESVKEKMLSCMGSICYYASDRKVRWEKGVMDLDALRSDTTGICYQFQGDADGAFHLAIGASPAALEHTCNVFGSDDILHCARVLVRTASKALDTILPDPLAWDLRRLDVTENYLLDSASDVREALRCMLNADVSRRSRAMSAGGDTVEFFRGSAIMAGKAYHKGPQVRYLLKRKKLPFASVPGTDLALLDRVLRLELKLAREFWKRREKSGECANWWEMTPTELTQIHHDFFRRFIGSVEVTDMDSLTLALEKICPSKRQAASVLKTWALIQELGYVRVRDSGLMSDRTWAYHLKYLKEAGLSFSDLGSGEILQFRRKNIVIGDPVTSWEDLRRAA